MKPIIRFFKSLWYRLSFFRYSSEQIGVNSRFQGKHDCALVALAKIFPDFPSDQMIQGFSNCCDRWPYAGVTNKEFNITLRHLELFDKFEYDDSDDMIVSHFLIKEADVFILLIYGHFTVVKHGKVFDTRVYTNIHSANVYCSWRLIAS